MPLDNLRSADEERGERLERWASILDRSPYQLIGLLPPSWTSGEDPLALVKCPSAIDIAWADPIFRVTGLAGRSRGQIKKFFGLSNGEFDRIASGTFRVPVRPACMVAARIRNVADPSLGGLQVVAGAAIVILIAVGLAQWPG